MPLALTRLVFNAAAFGHRQWLQAMMVSQALFAQVCSKLALKIELVRMMLPDFKTLVPTNLRSESIPPRVSKCKLQRARILYRFPFKQFSSSFDRFSTSTFTDFKLYGRKSWIQLGSFAQSWPDFGRINLIRFILSAIAH